MGYREVRRTESGTRLSVLTLALILGSALPLTLSPRVSASPLQFVILQPDPVNGTDTYILNTARDWNFGNNASLWVGRDAVNSSIDRSLLKFDLPQLPAGAIFVNASLNLNQYRAGSGFVQVHRATLPWTEGTGQRSWTRVPVVVQETAGVRRTLEPVGLTLAFPPGRIVDPARDLRVYSGSSEVPSQVYSYTYTGGQVTGATLYFEASMGAFQSRWFNITYSTNGTGVPAYRTKTWGSTPEWSFAYTGGGASGASIVDLDGDGKLDVVFGAKDGRLYDLNETLKLKRSVQLSTNQNFPYPPQIRDMDHDGRLDIVVLTNDPAIYRLNDTLGVVWTKTYATGNMPSAPPTLVDVNGDGVLDVLVSGKMNQVDALNGVNGAIIRSYLVGGSTFPASIKDINGDGQGEIFFGSDDGKVHAFWANGTQIWANASAGGGFIENALSIGDLDRDGIPEVITGDDTNNGPEFALRATDGRSLWFRAIPGYRESGQTLADLNGDGFLDATLGLYAGQVSALQGNNGAFLWNYTGGSNIFPDTPALVDIDKDGKPEIIYQDSGTLVRVLNTTGALIHSWSISANDYAFRTIVQHPCRSPAVVDLDGDGTMEVIVPTGTGLEAFSTGGLAKDWRTWGYNWNHTHRAGDGNSPDGATPLVVSAMAPQVYPGAGASWDFSDGTTPWATPGGDFLGSENTTASSAGWMTWNVTSMVKDWLNPLGFPNVGLVLTETDEVSGGLHGFYSSDAANPVLRPRLTISYYVPSPDPTPRITGRIPDQVKTEGSPPWTLYLGSFAFDNDTPLSDLRLNVSGFDPTKIQIDGLNTLGNQNLTFRPQPYAWGDMPVTYWLTDPQGHTARRGGWINLTPVNNPPSFNPPSSFIVHYNSTFVFDFLPYISDPDNPTTDLTLTTNDPVRARVSGFNVSFLYPQSLLNQWVFVTLTVSDGQASTSRVIPIKVTSDNPPKLTKQLPNITMMEGQLLKDVFDLDDYFTDPDRDSLFFSFGYTHLTITINPDHTVDMKAAAEWWGQERVTFRARDPTGAIAEDSIYVTVVQVNDPPAFGPVPDLTVRYDANYSFNLDPYLSDPDTPVDQLTLSSTSPYVTVSGHLITLLYPFALNNTVQNLTLSLSDGLAVVTKTIRVHVGADWPPELKFNLGDRSFDEDTVLRNAYNLAVAFGDPDGNHLFYSSGNVSVLVTIHPNGSVDLSALPNWFGTERVTFRATDPFGALAEDVVWITVNPVDDPPFFLPVPPVLLNTTSAFLDLTPYLGDVDTNISDLTLSTQDPNATVIGHGVLFTYSSDATDGVKIVVSDGILANSTIISVTVVLPKTAGGFPTFLYWLPFPIVAAFFGALVLYRRRQLEWLFLVTNAGLLVASVFRRGPIAVDTDLVTGLFTAIQDFATRSFSDETQRHLEGLELGDRRVALVRGERAYLAAVYRGRTPGFLPRTLKGLLTYIEAHHALALGDIVETSSLGEIPALLQRAMKSSWWPLHQRWGSGVADEAKEPPA